MSSQASKDQFLKQFEHIVDGIKVSRAKVSLSLLLYTYVIDRRTVYIRGTFHAGSAVDGEAKGSWEDEAG